MIKGSLKDISLPGLLQCLANEGNKSYRLKVERGSAHGDLVIVEGTLIAASYGLLSGDDAVCEFMTWDDGAFYVERLSPRFHATIDKNMSLRLLQVINFSDHASFLLENNIGLNTMIRPSRLFGTPEWQESSKLQPLQREDFLILGWLSGGRTMRDSMREFAFDLVQCTAILYRLILTRSVEVVRAGGTPEVPGVPGEVYREETPRSRISQEIFPGEAVAPQAVAAAADREPSGSEKVAAVSAAPPAVAGGAESESYARTTVLPIISIDIERLMKATFTITEFGFLALKNAALDINIRQTLLKVEAGQTVESAVEEASRLPAAVLSTYRYCMDRGYIANPDPVLQLTADLLLGRMELDQYLLQRRRVTGEELRDLCEAARNEGLKLVEVLVEKGFLSQEDLDTVSREQRRFSVH